MDISDHSKTFDPPDPLLPIQEVRNASFVLGAYSLYRRAKALAPLEHRTTVTQIEHSAQ